MALQYQALGPLLAGEGSRAFLGLEISEDGSARAVVLVWVPEDAENDPGILGKIRSETEHASHLEHPNIVKVHGFAKLDEGHARVVEFADAESLRKLLDTARRLPPRFAAKIVADAALGVHYAHLGGNDDGTPLIHGDLRPETLLLGFAGDVKVTGYGALAFAPREMGGQRVKGRRIHTAPEQIIGGREAFTLQTDVYLLGLTLHECLTGKVPFADQGDFFDHAVLTLPLPPPTPGEVPDELQKIIDTACAKKVPDRYPTPLAFREAVIAAMGGQLPSNEELAGFMRQWFPESDKARAARRQAIDAGIADMVRKQWAEKRQSVPPTPAASLPPPAPVPVPVPAPVVATPKPAPPAPAPKPAPAPVARRPAPVEEPDEPAAAQKKSMVPWMIAAGVVGAVVLMVVLTQTNRGARTPPPPPEPPKPVAEVVKPPPPPEPTPPAVVDAGAVAAIPPVPVDAGVKVPAKTTATLTLESTPSLELTIDGKSLGKTPFKGELPPGRTVLVLANKDLGIRTTRVAMLKAGETESVTVTLKKGFVTLSAPDGARVQIDDRKIGNAPIRGEIPVWEGSHRITVFVGKARWSQAFNLAGDQRINFNVEHQ